MQTYDVDTFLASPYTHYGSHTSQALLAKTKSFKQDPLPC